METIPLSASARDTSVTPSVLRRQGQVPCVVYGNKTENTVLQCEEMALKRAYIKAGESTIVELDTGSKKVPVLFHAIDFDPLSDRLIHVDFYAVDMKKELEATVPVHFVGESPAVKDLDGLFITPKTEVTVRCLPSNLPHALEVDISILVELHSSLTVADIKLPEGVEIVDGPEEVLAIVQEKRAEEVEAPPVPAEGEASAGAEGAAPAEGAAEGEKKDEE